MASTHYAAKKDEKCAPHEPNTIFPIGKCLCVICRVLESGDVQLFLVFIFHTNIEIECDTMNEIASSSSSAVHTELLHRHTIPLIAAHRLKSFTGHSAPHMVLMRHAHKRRTVYFQLNCALYGWKNAITWWKRSNGRQMDCIVQIIILYFPCA